MLARDMTKAAEFYARAAEGGDFRGQFNHARMLAESGDLAAARGWLVRCGETATSAFTAKARAWIRGSRWPELESALPC